jgi:outer membrane protein insertion porin family
LSFGASAQQWATFTPAYESNTTGGNATVTQSFGLQNTLSLSLIRERTKSIIAEEVRNDPSLIDDLIALGLDPTTNSQEGTLTAIGIEARRSTADNLFSPTRGYQLTLTLQKAGLGLGTFNYMALQTDARHYLPLSDRLVLANRVQMGNINPAGADEVNVPFSKKFFLGGATTLRGWSRYEVSPLSTSGFPLGGNSVLGFSTELRSAVKGNFGLVGFLDGGNVWSNSWDIDVTDLRYAIGPGLRYQTPIGPIRFDMGYQLNPIPGLLVNGVPQTRRFRFHFSIGQAF